MEASMLPWMKMRKELPGITDGIVATYKEGGIGNHIAAHPLPSKTEIVQIVYDVLEILFPGYLGDRSLQWSNVKYFVGNKVDDLYGRLVMQIWRCVRHECRRLEAACDHCEEHAERSALHFLRGLPALRQLLIEDVEAAYEGDPAAAGYDEIIFSYPCVLAISTYRIGNLLHGLRLPLLPRIMTEWAHNETGIDIHPGATIGGRFFIDHGTGVVIGETCDIGNNVKIYQGVTLGALSLENVDKVRGRKRHPTIEDDVVIYANTTILGDTTIGKGSIINGNVFITQSVPPYTRVGIEAPKLKFKESSVRKNAAKGKGKAEESKA